MQSYGIDGHKLHLHPQRVSQWLQGENIYPLYMEMALAGACNHRCVFCTMDFMGYKTRFPDPDMLEMRFQEFGALGVRAVMFAGEGEPLLHRHVCRIAASAKNAGLDISFTTNGVLLDAARSAQLLPITSWIKVSCNAGSPESYASIHRAPAGDFEKVMLNMEAAAQRRQAEGSHCTLGFQSLLLPDNMAEMPMLARRVREIGADYLVIKPYTRHPLSLTGHYDDLRYDDCHELSQRLAEEERPGFRIIFRHEAMRRWDTRGASFEHCLALPFWTYVDAGANVWGCSRHLGVESFCYGNLQEQDFASIWNSPKRLNNVAHCATQLDVGQCHVTCRMELVNAYLWRLRHPQPHDNFI